MSVGTQPHTPAATVDVKQLNTLWWGPVRQLFPSFVEEMELGRYLSKLLATSQCRAVQLQPHRDADGRTVPHVVDVYFVDDAP